MRCHEGVLSWHADEGIRRRPDLIFGYMAKEAMLQTLYDWVDGVCTKEKKVLQAAQLDMRAQEVYAGPQEVTGYAPGQTTFNTVSQEGDACKVTEGAAEGEVV